MAEQTVAARTAARVAALKVSAPAPNTKPLNAGFFTLEAMRMNSTKKKAVVIRVQS